MTREEIKILLPVITAYAEGKEIELEDSDGNWHDTALLSFCRPPKCYRIKQESKYRPFESAEEFLNVMKQHTPYGYIRLKNARYGILEYCNIVSFTNKDIILQTYQGSVTTGYALAFETLVFSDGAPFGILEEE